MKMFSPAETLNRTGGGSGPTRSTVMMMMIIVSRVQFPGQRVVMLWAEPPHPGLQLLVYRESKTVKLIQSLILSLQIQIPPGRPPP